MNARRVETYVTYKGIDITNYIIDFNYTDNSDQTDDISVTLSDRDDL